MASSLIPALNDAASLAKRLQAQYEEQFEQAGATVVIGASPVDLSAEVLWGGRVGPGLYVRVPFARRRWLFGPLRPIRTLENAELVMRAHLQGWLQKHPWRSDPG
jgi:hypothetical protein